MGKKAGMNFRSFWTGTPAGDKIFDSITDEQWDAAEQIVVSWGEVASSMNWDMIMEIHAALVIAGEKSLPRRGQYVARGMPEQVIRQLFMELSPETTVGPAGVARLLVKSKLARPSKTAIRRALLDLTSIGFLERIPDTSAFRLRCPNESASDRASD